jgi:hypothetical protein
MRSYHPAMPMWRCPHCATPQPEAARCWVCHRSSTCCATCRHFRPSIAAQLGYCALGRYREPLAGGEIRACWESGVRLPETASAPIGSGRAGPGGRTPVRERREFVPIDEARGEPTVAIPITADPSPSPTGPPRDAVPAAGNRGPDGWTLFPDLER